MNILELSTLYFLPCCDHTDQMLNKHKAEKKHEKSRDNKKIEE